MSEKPTLMENHPIQVNTERVIGVPKDKIIKPEGGKRKRKVRINNPEGDEQETNSSSDEECETCSKGCHCKGWDKAVSTHRRKYY